MEIVINFFLFLLLISLARCGLSIAPFMPTRKKDLARIHSLMNLQTWEKVLEVGFWDSRVSRYIAKNNPHALIFWVELSPFLYLYAKLLQVYSPLKNLKLHLKNAFSENFWEYDVIYIFGMPENLKTKLKSKFLNELKPWARVISYSFFIDQWPGEIKKDKPREDTLSIYVMTKK